MVSNRTDYEIISCSDCDCQIKRIIVSLWLLEMILCIQSNDI